MKLKMVTSSGGVHHPNHKTVITNNITTPIESNNSTSPVEPTKRTNDNRRSNKPIMEKRRRARINNCLNELKTLILDAMKKDPARHSKLEKADILEMTVKHFENVQKQQAAITQAVDPNVLNKFKAGFTDCANEVSRFPGIDPVIKRRLLQHLSNCINGVKTEIQIQPLRQQSPVTVNQPILPLNAVKVRILSPSPNSVEQEQQLQSPITHHFSQITSTVNGYFLTNESGTGIQLIPTKLSNGNIAFVLPQTVQSAPLPMLIPIPTRTSSTASAASNTSSNYDRILNEDLITPNNCYIPQLSNTTVNNQTRSFSPVPLSLVIKKVYNTVTPDEKPWRPW